MKHLWSTHEFTLRQQRRQRKFDRRRHLAQKRQTALRERPTRLRSTRSRQRELPLPAPATLSLFGKPDETLKYCNTLRKHLTQPGMKIFLDLGDVQNFTSDALLLIRAIMDSRARHTQIGGNLPRGPTVASEFKASGFFAGFAKPPEDLPLPKGLILKKSNNTVRAKIAAELVDFAKEHMPIAKECTNACFQTHDKYPHPRGGSEATFSPKMVCQRLLPRSNCLFQLYRSRHWYSKKRTSKKHAARNRCFDFLARTNQFTKRRLRGKNRICHT